MRTTNLKFSVFDKFFGGHLPTVGENLTIVVGDMNFSGTVIEVDQVNELVIVEY